MLNFIPIPHAIMNEVFHKPIKHNWLQIVIQIFTLHICPRATWRTSQHCHKKNEYPGKFPIAASYHLSFKRIV
jgi:hypothetical protein